LGVGKDERGVCGISQRGVGVEIPLVA
jgi:hypothetical protein